jgi:hypothetical protein
LLQELVDDAHSPVEVVVEREPDLLHGTRHDEQLLRQLLLALEMTPPELVEGNLFLLSPELVDEELQLVEG